MCSKLFLVFIYLSIDSHSLASDVNSAKIVFYYGPTYDDHQSYDLDKVASILDHPKFIGPQTTMFMHGYNLSQEASSVHLIVDSYLKRDSINFLALDWSELAGGTYISAQENVLKLAPKVAEAILELFSAGLNKDSLSLVGHSLGGLGVGAIAREVVKQSNGNVLLPRITALDPSNAAAYDEFLVPPIERADARFVDVIHTDSGKVGSPESMGHADFWPNGGKRIQPGCPAEGVNDRCNHRKAWAYWAETVVSEKPFWAFRAQSYEEFLEIGGDEPSVPMGIDCPASARGDYYLKITSDFGSVPEIGLPQ